jgi:mycothiol synthase
MLPMLRFIQRKVSCTEWNREMSQLLMVLPAPPTTPQDVHGSASGTGVRPATTSDNDAIARLLASAFPDQTWTPERVAAELTQAPDVLRVFVLNDGDRIVATASARRAPDQLPGRGSVHWVGVSPDAQGRGLGRLIVSEVIDFFRSVDVSPVVLETDDERLAALSSYLGLGFIPHYADADHEQRWSLVFLALNAARHRRGDR